MLILFIFLSINLQDSNPLFFSFSVKDSTEFLLGIPPDGNLDIDIHDGIKNSVQILRTGILRNQRVALIRVNGYCEASINFTPYPSKDPARGDEFEDILKKIIVNYDIAKYWKIEKSKGQKVEKSKGPRYKIIIKHEGIYRIGYSVLSGIMEDIDIINPKNFGMEHMGFDVPIFVSGEEDNSFDPVDYIEFYGEKIRGEKTYLNLYTDENVYWLMVDNIPGPRLVTIDGTPDVNFSIQNTYRDTVHFEEDNMFWRFSEISSDTIDPWFWMCLPEDTTFIIPVFIDTLEMFIKFHGRDDLSHTFSIYLNDIYITQETFSGACPYVFHTIIGNISQQQENYLRIQSNGDLLLNWIEINGRRELVSEKNLLKFSLQNTGCMEFRMTGFTTDDLSIMERGTKYIINPAIVLDNGSYKVSFKDTVKGENTYYIVDSPKTPETIKKVAYSGLSSTSMTSPYIVITDTSLISDGEIYAGWREGIAVTTEEIYDEFNYGIKHPEAIRDFLEFAVRYWEEPPLYCLLLGDASYDYRDIYGYGDNIVPPYLSFVPGYGFLSTDSYYSYLIGDDEFPDIFIGRVPVMNHDEFSGFFQKMVLREDTLSYGEWRKRYVFCADVYEDCQDVMNGLKDSFFPSDYDENALYHGIHENEDVMNVFNTGCSMLAFIGHGAAGRWTGGPFFTKEDILRLGNLTRLPFVYTVSCYEGVFDEPGANSIGEGLVIAPNGGAVAHFGTGGLMYLSSVVLGRSMLTYLFDEHINTLGALTSLARLHYSKGEQYTLLGDPLAEIPISCLEIDMEPEPASVSPGDTVHITGRTDPEVSGEAILTFYLPDSLPIKKEDVDIIEGEFSCIWEIPNGEGEALVKVYAYGDDNEGVASTRFMVEGIDIRNIFTIPESPTIRDSVWLNAEISYKLPIDSAGLFWSEDTTLLFIYIPMISESGLYKTVTPIYTNSPGRVYYRIYAVSVDGVIRITELNSYTIPTLPDLMPEGFPFLTVRDSVFICQIVKNAGGEHVEEFIASFYTISAIDTVPIGYDTLSLDGNTEDTACVYWNLKQGGVIIKLDEENKVEEENEDNNIVDYTEVDVTLFNISPIEGTRGKVGLSGCVCEMDSGIVDRSCVLEILKDDSIYSVKIIPEIIKPEKDYSIWLTLPEEERGVQTEFGLYNLPLDFYRWVRLDAIKDSIFLRTKTDNIGLFSIFPVGDTISPDVNILSEDDITIYNSFPHFNAIAYDSYGIDVIEKGIKVFLDGIELNRENYSFPIEPDNIDEVPIMIRPDSLVDGRYILIVQAWDVNGNMGCDSLLFEKATHLKLQKWGVYPNPASTQTKFWFKFTKPPEDVKVEIYTTGGRLIEKLTCITITQEVTVPWNLRDNSGRKVANGAYFFRLRASCEGENVEFIEKMAVVR